jgi:hypothetical protein
MENGDVDPVLAVQMEDGDGLLGSAPHYGLGADLLSLSPYLGGEHAQQRANIQYHDALFNIAHLQTR